jgi:penicillin-binding protein 1A
MAVGVYLGYDKPRQIGTRATGGGIAAPIVKEFLKVALADKPAVPFRVPPGLKLIRIDPKSGTRIAAGSSGGLLEAFKPGTAPPDSYSVIGYEGGGEARGPSPEADSALRRGGLW